ncbi:unnamed protein product [Ilex paraguariensis]|uniref:Uncharacterized protein n=1 Tax=Ilex paraguariensis TaxID=185542 RepID=A0ABC8SMJ4_9AQUA
MELSTKEVEGAQIWRPQMHAHGKDIHSKDSVVDNLNITIGLAKVSILPPNLCILEDLDDDALARNVVQLMTATRGKDVKETLTSRSLDFLKAFDKITWLQDETIEKSKKAARDMATLGKGLNSSLKFNLEALLSSIKIAMDEAYDKGFEKAKSATIEQVSGI